MSESWYDYRRRAKITFNTRAPDDARAVLVTIGEVEA